MNTKFHHNTDITTTDMREILTFSVDGQIFGIPVLQVLDVITVQNVAMIPLTPKEIVGSINLRGRIVTVLDLHHMLDLDWSDENSEERYVVVENGQEAYSVRVDEVGEVMSVSARDFEQCPSTLNTKWKGLSTGLYRLKEGLLIILDVSSIIENTIEAAA